MINIADKTKCRGYRACFNICSKNAVSMESDSEGFVYPKINANMIKYNPAFVSSASIHLPREYFFARYKNENLNKLISELLNEKPLMVKILNNIFKKLGALL